MPETLRLIILLLILAGLAGPAKSQTALSGRDSSHSRQPIRTQKRLLYVVEGNQNYMIPYIERKLMNLRKPDTDSILYGKVENLNVLANTIGVEANVYDILRQTYGSGFAIGQLTSGKKAKNTSNILQNYESILVIQDTTLQDLVELQFTLYSIVKKGSGNGLEYRNSSSVFVDPRSSRYQADVNRVLDQVFEEAGKEPKVNVVTNIPKIDSVYFFTAADTLRIEPIIDDESQEDDRIYFWVQDDKDSIKPPIQPSKKNQLLTGLAPGTYRFYFKVSNGINYSKPETIRLEVYANPVLTVVRPDDHFYFKKFNERLVIQEYLFTNRYIEYFSNYLVTVDTGSLGRKVPTLWVRVTDKKGNEYAKKTFPFTNDIYNSEDGGKRYRSAVTGKAIISDPDSIQVPFKPGKGNRYQIAFQAKTETKESKEKVNDLNVFQRLPIALLYDVMMFPVDKNGLFHSWINAGAGVDIRFNKWLSGVALVGTDLAQASFQHFYTDLLVNFGPYKHFEGGPALLINHDNGQQSTGFKIAYSFYTGEYTSLKLGASFYNQDHINYYAIHFTGDIFLNH